MKKQAILIQCYDKPEIVNAIIEYFPEDSFDFYIHVDKKSTIISSIKRQNNVFLVRNRVDVRWGQFSQISATLALIGLIQDPLQYSYCHLISGNDFPVKTPEWMQDTFNEKNHNEYIESRLIDGSGPWSWGGLDRIECFYPQWIIRRPTNIWVRIPRVLYREFIMRTRIFKRRNTPVERFYIGSQWWTLTGKMINWIKNNIGSDYMEFYKHGVCMDEVFFSTLVRYSPYRNKIADSNMRFMIWDKNLNNTGGPIVLNRVQYINAINSDKAFCRKVLELSSIQE